VDLWESLMQETNMIPILARMEIVGVGFDPSQFNEWIAVLEPLVAALSVEATQLLGRSINLSSTQDVAVALRELGLRTGLHHAPLAAGVDDFVLSQLEHKHPFPRTCLVGIPLM